MPPKFDEAAADARQTTMNWGTVNVRILDCRKCLGAAARFARRASAAFAILTALVLIALLVAAPGASAQTAAAAPQSTTAASSGGIHGQIADPTGAVIPGANVVILSSAGKVAGKTKSDSSGAYAVHGLAPGTYSVWVTAQGFAAYRVPNIVVSAGQMKTLNPALQIQVEKQEVQVQAENTTISTAADANASAVIIKGNDLNALSDDPDELQNELQALAGPAAGPNGGQIYIDGFTGGQLPPKSSIREIRVNQNPFSAEYDRLGYGRIEIFTKPGTDKLHGQYQVAGNDSSFNSQNPILYGKTEPAYSSWFMHGNVGGPITKSSSYFVSVFAHDEQNESILEAIDPSSVSLVTNSDGTTSLVSSPVNEAFANPFSHVVVSPRVDIQLGKANTLTVRYEYNRAVDTDGGLNPLSLPEQAINTHDLENTVQLSDSLVLSPKLVDDIRFQYRRIRNNQSAVSNLPSVTVQGSFSDGGSNSQSVVDHENNYELQDYLSGAFGPHSLNFGARLRAYDDVNSTTSGSNGSYIFQGLSDFVGCVQPSAGSCSPQQYGFTETSNPLASATIFDAGLFYQDDWKVNPRFTFSYGLRWETQNWIHDKDDWAPRLTLAYALGRSAGKQQPKTVVRAGYGWFFQRFNVANGFGANVPYVIQTIHLSADRKHENALVVNNPSFYYPNQPGYDPSNATTGSGLSAPTYYSIAPNMHAANDMEAAIGVDRQLSKTMTGNVTYVYSQGIHQYFTDNLSAAAQFPASNAADNTYPAAVIPAPSTNNLQYQSGGFYREHQVMVTVRATYRRFSFFTNYTFSNAHGDTSGVGSVPSVSSHPGLDYGRTSFDVANRFFILGNFMFPWKISASPMLVANAGNPFNITTGADLTGNNQFNARPTYASDCSEPTAIQTRYGCFDLPYGAQPTTGTPIAPYAVGEKIVPYGLGTGPSNVSINMRLSKVIGIGPVVEGGHGAGGGGGYHGGPPGLGGGGLSGSRGGPGRLDARVSRRYSLTFSAWGTNILNHENLGTPNGVIGATPNSATGAIEPQKFFLTSQSLAGGFFGSQTAGNRSLTLQAMFSF